MKHHAINYVELGAVDIEKTKTFYAKAFGWTFVDYGPDYVAFKDSGLEGGFTKESKTGTSPLVILYSERLEESRDTIASLGGKIVKDIFDFPGGRRFHFADPNGNELAVWSDKKGSDASSQIVR